MSTEPRGELVLVDGAEETAPIASPTPTYTLELHTRVPWYVWLFPWIGRRQVEVMKVQRQKREEARQLHLAHELLLRQVARGEAIDILLKIDDAKLRTELLNYEITEERTWAELARLRLERAKIGQKEEEVSREQRLAEKLEKDAKRERMREAAAADETVAKTRHALDLTRKLDRERRTMIAECLASYNVPPEMASKVDALGDPVAAEKLLKEHGQEPGETCLLDLANIFGVFEKAKERVMR